MQRHRNDFERVVDDSYGFLNDMPDGSGGTLPRDYRIGSMKDGSVISTRQKSKINYWEPRLKSVRDIAPQKPPRQRVEPRVQSLNRPVVQPDLRDTHYGDRRYDDYYDRGQSVQNPATPHHTEQRIEQQVSYHNRPVIQPDPRNIRNEQARLEERGQSVHNLAQSFRQREQREEPQVLSYNRSVVQPDPRNISNGGGRYDEYHDRGQSVQMLTHSFNHSDQLDYHQPPSRVNYRETFQDPQNVYSREHLRKRNDQSNTFTRNQNYGDNDRSRYEERYKGYSNKHNEPQRNTFPRGQPQGSSLLQYTNNQIGRQNAAPRNWEDVHKRSSDDSVAVNVKLAEKGSYLLQRSNHYYPPKTYDKRCVTPERDFSAVKTTPVQIVEMKKTHGADKVKVTAEVSVRVKPNSPSLRPVEKSVENKIHEISSKRGSVLDHVEIKYKELNPPPPPPPPPPSGMMNITPPTPIKHTDPRQSKQWVIDLKNGRKALKSNPPGGNKGLRRIDATEPEPDDFKYKLNQILQSKLVKQRWSKVDTSEKNEEPPTPINVKPAEQIGSIKTLTKAAMKNKLEGILVKGPPNRPSFREAFDMNRGNVAKFRSVEQRAIQHVDSDDDFSDEFDNEPLGSVKVVEPPDGHMFPPPPTQNSDKVQHKLQMSGVLSTIRLKGRLENEFANGSIA